MNSNSRNMIFLFIFARHMRQSPSIDDLERFLFISFFTILVQFFLHDGVMFPRDILVVSSSKFFPFSTYYKGRKYFEKLLRLNDEYNFTSTRKGPYILTSRSLVKGIQSDFQLANYSSYQYCPVNLLQSR